MKLPNANTSTELPQKIPQRVLFTLAFFLVGFFVFGTGHVYAFDLINFIAQPTFPDHSLSTGEAVSYTSEGGSGPASTAVRQYKNSNYEQFFVGSNGIYRREDTSWAPNGADAICGNGNRAAYTLDGTDYCTEYADGATVNSNSGAWWAPATGSFVGQQWQQQRHQIVPIDTNALPQLRHCVLSQPSGTYDYPNACGQIPGLTITGYFEIGEYTFCGGNTNSSPVVTMSGSAGPGSGDGFVYMEGCGLVGFRDAGLNMGIVEGCGVSAPDPATVAVNCTSGGGGVPGPGGDTGVEIIFEGRVRSLFQQQDNKGNLIAGMPIENALVVLYQGSPETDAGNKYGRITKISDSEDATDSSGNFTARGLRVRGGQFGSFENANYLVIWCDGPDPVDIWKMNLSEETVKKDYYVPCSAGRISSPRGAPDSFDLGYLGQQMQCGVIEEGADYLVAFEDPAEGSVDSTEIAPGYGHPIKLEGPQTNEWPRGSVGDPIDPTGWNLPYTLENPTEGFPGRNELAGVGWAPDVTVNLAGDYNVGQKHPTRVGDTLEDQLQSCEEIKRCNQIMAGEDAGLQDNRNNHTCYNLASKLSDPGMWGRLYPIAFDRNEAVCTMKNGDIINFNQIEPPFETDLPFGNVLDKEYFPYLFLIGDPQTGVRSMNWQQSTWDSFNTGDQDQTVVRDEPYSGSITEADQKVSSWTETQASNDPSFSRDVKDTLVNSNQAQDMIGEEKGLAGILSDYDVPFSAGNPDVLATGNDNIIRVGGGGRGDFQIGRTYELCSVNRWDYEGANYFNEDLCRYEDHPWCSGFKYLAQERSIIDPLLDLLCAAPILGDLFRLFEECIDAGEYEYAARDTDIFWAEFKLPTRDAWEAGAVPMVEDWEGRTVVAGNACATWQQGDPVGDCNCEEVNLADCNDSNLAPFVCKRELVENETCREGCGGGSYCEWFQCEDDYKPIDPGDPPKCCRFIERRWTHYRAHYTCPGDIWAWFKGENISWQYAPFNRDDGFGVAQIAESLGTPYDVHRQCATLTLTNYEITDQESPDRDTRAFNSGKIDSLGCTENTLGRFMMSVADYAPEASGPSTDPYGTYTITIPGNPQEPGQCNEFNCFAAGVETFEDSLACAAATLRTGINNSGGETWYTVDRYGPYCDNETRHSPFGYNLFNFIDLYAESPYARPLDCQEVPPNTLMAGTEGMECPAQGDPIREPGHPAFNYYRGALVTCPIDTSWTRGAVTTLYDQICGGEDIYYSGTHLNSPYNCDGGVNSRVYRVLEAASNQDVNPWLLLGIWATESHWGFYGSCGD